MSKAELLLAYRQLYRGALQAIRYSTPGRYHVQDIIRQSFRNESADQFNPVRVQNTLKFLEKARQFNGLEHRILKNILISYHWRANFRRSERKAPWMRNNDESSIEIRRNLYSHLDATLIMLNETMELCLRSSSLKEEREMDEATSELEASKITKIMMDYDKPSVQPSRRR